MTAVQVLRSAPVRVLHTHPHASALQDIFAGQLLQTVFQPIVDLHAGAVIGFEGLVRGPSDSALHAPTTLFRAAEECGCQVPLDLLCQKTSVGRYAEQRLPGRLFLNVNPESLLFPGFKPDRILRHLGELGLSPSDIVIEITECFRALDYALLRTAAHTYQELGFAIALDDLGEGSSSLRLWSELRPDFVKIDKHFVQHLHQDPVKQQFVRSIQHIAENARTQVIAEGIETLAELASVRQLGIRYGQGYALGRPSLTPAIALPPEVLHALADERKRALGRQHRRPTANSIRFYVRPVPSHTSNQEVFELFSAQPDLQAVPVVDADTPIGLLKRQQFLERFAKPFARELLGRKPCTLTMDKRPMIVDRDRPLEEVSRVIAYAERHYLIDGFIVTHEGRYAGMGTGYDLMRALTDLQLNAARYANPLTLLPGNVPISEQIEMWLDQGLGFVACYIDINAFKPFNDYYGYRRGDEVIETLGRLISEHIDSEQDFAGHIGGDDFVMLMRSNDWQARCERLLQQFALRIHQFHSAEHIDAGGYHTENRRGDREFHSLLSIAIGAVPALAQHYHSHHQIAAAMADAKRQAKRAGGNALFIERRRMPEPGLPATARTPVEDRPA